ncbi:MAG: tripartite tricarboxylate transporter TctB family protein [Rhodoferax sp.]|nr:tripartite tricarboxylate transporter TctB family protein [Rhodoferax sp.]
MSIRNQKDFFAGLLFAALGVVFAWGAQDYQVGSSARMGPGYFPLLLGLILAALGLVVMARSIRRATASERINAWAWRPLVAIISANLLFGVALGGLPNWGVPALGLMLGIYGLTFVASLAGQRFNLREVSSLACALALLSYVAFVLLLKLPLALWPWN